MNKIYRKGAVGAIMMLAIAMLIAPEYLCAQIPDIEAKIKSVPPVTYPAEASKTGLEGKVTVVVEIDETSKVTKVNEASGPDSVCPNNNRADVVAMRHLAQEGARKAVFIPASKDGKPIASQVRMTFSFKNPSPKKPTEGGPTIGARVVQAGEQTKLTELSTTTSETKTISGGVLNGKALALAKPAYPPAAKAIGASGAVQVQVVIDTNGTMFKAEAKSGHPLLRAASVSAACSSRFAPTLLNNDPVLVAGIITYNFTIDAR